MKKNSPSEPTPTGEQRGKQRGKQRKPKFKRQESWRYTRVNERWRRPVGIDSKMRKKTKGWPPSPQIGYRTPKRQRGLHPSGYLEVSVHTAEDLYELDPRIHAVRIARTVGGKKRAELLVLAEERRIFVLNPRRQEEPTEPKELEEGVGAGNGGST
jgi:large subunit ribosomal protein L32e